MKIRYCVVCLTLLASSAPAFAQVDAAIATVKQHFVQNEARYGASAEDLAELIVTDAYTGRRTNATYVYLRQAHNGIEVYNATAQAVVTSDNEIMSPHARFVSDLANRVNTDSPGRTAEGAARSAENYLRTISSTWFVESDAITDGPITIGFGLDYFVFVPEATELVYFALDNGDVRLAWDISLDTKDKQHYFTARVDAVNGRVLDYGDLVDHDNWGTLSHGRSESIPNYAPIEPNNGFGGPEYNVFAVPVESPNHGSRSLEFDPADPIASSLGWHDDNSSSYTTTQGNNVHAYTDTDDNNVPDPGSSPDGGGSLIFDFPLDLSDLPDEYSDAAVTNLFYWNNIIHDVLYQYGFDEASGNFQEDNLGNGGIGSDYVNAEAQDGGSLNNANFSTPSDGGNPRMQMYLWSPGDEPAVFEVTAPPIIAGEYPTQISTFGAFAGMMGDVEAVVDTSAAPELGCFDLTNDLTGQIALIKRGICEFGVKVLNAENAGAIGAIVYNNVGDVLVLMGGGVVGDQVTIPNYFVFQSTGEAIAGELPGVTVDVTPGNFHDGDFDNGIIVHEYGHGISNRLTGGPSNVNCLGNDERPSEGWSDYYGLMLTQEVGDAGADRRGIGTYVINEPTDGTGIRPAPYSTDFGINGFTYQDSRTQVIPHGVGFVWATAIWEMTWELIDAHGFDPDIYDATGTAGNQISLSLVTEGLKLQPCSPGFVDARNAILVADKLLYDGANTDLIWDAFARRGLGVLADQGSSGTNADNTEDFTSGASSSFVLVDPTSIDTDVVEGETVDVPVTITNIGGEELTWSLSTPPTWLSFSASSGSVPAGSTDEVTFTLDAGTIPADSTEMATVTMTTNAPGGGASIDIDVEMNVILFVANEGEMDFPGTHLLSEAYPNPFNPTATFTLAVAEPQNVQIALYDVRGRLITMLNDGILSGRTMYTYTIDGHSLTSGTYFVQIVGEKFAENRRVTLLR